MSREFHLITRHRPAQDVFAAALRDAGAATPDREGDFEDPNAYFDVSGPRLWMEIEPPGHVEAADLADAYAPGTALPEPDSEQCLRLAVANIPAGAPAGSAGIAWRVFEDLAARCQGIAIEP